MSIKSIIIPRAAAFLTSRRLRSARRIAAELKRRLTMKPHVIEVYLRIDDPYSHVLVQVLDSITDRFSVELELRAMATVPAEMTPDVDRLAAWAHRDASALASQYDLTPPGEPRSARDVDTASLLLAEACGRGLGAVQDLFDDVARGGPLEPPVDADDARATLAANERSLRRDGHYMSAMLFYGDEWYWGIDRLNHLEQRLIEGEVARAADEAPMFDKRLSFLAEPGVALVDSPPLVMYWSARSPYSYLALGRARQLADAFSVDLELRPILPMVMRGLSVPRQKRFYLLLDGKREADLHDIAYGRVCDPLGTAIERCYGVFDHAKEKGRAHEWALAFTTAVWGEGVDGSSDAGLRLIAERAGLDPETCVARSKDEAWREWVVTHRNEILEGGFWGVPIFRWGDLWVWGQDRFWVLEAAMRSSAVK